MPVKMSVGNNFLPLDSLALQCGCPHLLLLKEVGEASFAGLFYFTFY